MTDAVRSILEEYASTIVDGVNDQGDFYIMTHKRVYLDDICRRIKPHGYMLSDSNFNDVAEYCTSRFQPYDEWFEHPYFFKF